MSVEIEILNQKKNRILGRIELNFSIKHEGEPTPQRDDVRSLVAGAMKSKKDMVIIGYMRSQYGKSETRGYAKVYENMEKVKTIEAPYALKRHAPGKKKAPAEGTEGGGEKEEKGEEESKEDKGGEEKEEEAKEKGAKGEEKEETKEETE